CHPLCRPELRRLQPAGAAPLRLASVPGSPRMTHRLANKVALVTGGSRGIGAAIVAAFAAEGADVAFCHDASDDEAAAVTSAAAQNGTRVLAMRCDVADSAAVVAFHKEAERQLGRIDILVNNAGISGEAPFERITLD